MDKNHTLECKQRILLTKKTQDFLIHFNLDLDCLIEMLPLNDQETPSLTSLKPGEWTVLEEK